MTVSGIRGKVDYGYSIAITFLGLNELEAAMEWLEKSYNYGSLWSLGFRSDPILTTLRDDPDAKYLWAKMIYPVPGIDFSDAIHNLLDRHLQTERVSEWRRVRLRSPSQT